MTLSPRHQLFVTHYIATRGNGTEAAIAAGYSPRTAKAQASRLLTSVNVSRALAGALKDKLEQPEASAERVLYVLSCIANFDGRAFFTADGKIKPMSQWTAEHAAAVNVEITKAGPKWKPFDKNRALEILAKYHQLFTERVEAHVTIDNVAQRQALEPLTDQHLARLGELLAIAARRQFTRAEQEEHAALEQARNPRRPHAVITPVLDVINLRGGRR